MNNNLSHWNKSIKSFVETFDEWSKLYSHSKFESIISSTHFKMIFKVFWSQKYDKFLSGVTAVTENIEVYIWAITQLKSIWGFH